MFCVICISALDERWEERDQEMFKMAGRQSDHSSGDYSSDRSGPGRREHVWYVRSFREARRMMRDLGRVDGVKVTIREK